MPECCVSVVCCYRQIFTTEKLCPPKITCQIRYTATQWLIRYNFGTRLLQEEKQGKTNLSILINPFKTNTFMWFMVQIMRSSLSPRNHKLKIKNKLTTYLENDM